MRTVLGVDADSYVWGVVLLRDGRLADRALLSAPREQPLGPRLILLQNALRQVLGRGAYAPQLAAIEEPNATRNVKTQLVVAAAATAAFLTTWGAGIETCFVNNAHWKRQLGVKTGGGTHREGQKQEARALLCARFPDLSPVATPQDVIDAAGLALYTDEVLMPRIWVPCPGCGTTFSDAGQRFDCWRGHAPDLLRQTTRNELAAALGVTGSRLSQLLKERGLKKPYTRKEKR